MCVRETERKRERERERESRTTCMMPDLTGLFLKTRHELQGSFVKKIGLRHPVNLA